ncbi:MAG TPA: hypothetical protein VIW64_16140 [Pyrinomonadaceae bacterium]|jgi:hypothetical protein
MAVEYPLTIDGETGFELVFVYRTKSGHESLIPAGSTARMVMRDISGQTAPVELTTESGHIALDAAAGRATTTIPRTEAAAIGFKQANYKWYLHLPSGIRKKLFFGTVRKV